MTTMDPLESGNSTDSPRLEPILIVGMALVVGFIVMAVLLPIMDIGTSIRR